jgi:DNA-binding transcriptional LysR family regulator
MAMDALLTDVIKEFGREHPGIGLSLSEMSTNDVLAAVRQGSVQIGFPRLYGHDLGGLESEIILRERYILAVPIRHPLAGQKQISLPDLERVSLIISPRPIQPRVYDRIVESCRECGFDPEIKHETVSRRTSMSLVAAGMGVSIITASAGRVPWPGVVFRPIDAEWPAVEIAAVWPRRGEPPALLNFLDIVRRHKRDDVG